MSRVLALFIEMRAMTSPALHRRARFERDDRIDRQRIAGVAAARQFHDLAVPALDDHRRTCRLAERGDMRQSMTMRLAMPVDSSICSDIEAPSTRSSKPITPGVSVMIGTRIGIPFGDALAALHLVAIVDLEARAVLHAMNRPLGAVCDRRSPRRRCAPSPSCRLPNCAPPMRLRIFTSPSKLDSMKD